MKTIPDYAAARCIAVKRDGKRCTGGWQSAICCIWAWDPVKGVGTEGPLVVLCGRHRRAEGAARRAGRRYRIVGGWLGPYNVHRYGNAVWAAPTGWKPAPLWWAHRRATRFGEVGYRGAMGPARVKAATTSEPGVGR